MAFGGDGGASGRRGGEQLGWSCGVHFGVGSFFLGLMLRSVGNLGYHHGDTGDGLPGTERKGKRMTATKKNKRAIANLTSLDGRIVATIDPEQNDGRLIHSNSEAEIDLGDEIRIIQLGQFLGNKIVFGKHVALFDYNY